MQNSHKNISKAWNFFGKYLTDIEKISNLSILNVINSVFKWF